MSQELDPILVQFASSLERREINIEKAIALMRARKVFDQADGANVQQFLRLSFLVSYMTGFESAYWNAQVAYVVAKNLKQPDINYGLQIGIGNAVVCSLFGLTTILTRMNRQSEALPYLQEMLPLLQNDQDMKGYLEVLVQLAQTEYELKKYNDAANHFKQCLSSINSLSNPDKTLSERSSQDMIRIDNKNVFDFGPPSIIELADVQLVRLILNHYIAESLIEAKKHREALAFSSQAVAIWENKQLAPGFNPSVIARALNSHAVVLVNLHDLPKAVQIANMCLAQARAAKDKGIELAAVFLLAYCFQEFGNRTEETKYRNMAAALAKELEKGSRR